MLQDSVPDIISFVSTPSLEMHIGVNSRRPRRRVVLYHKVEEARGLDVRERKQTFQYKAQLIQALLFLYIKLNRKLHKYHSQSQSSRNPWAPANKTCLCVSLGSHRAALGGGAISTWTASKEFGAFVIRKLNFTVTC